MPIEVASIACSTAVTESPMNESRLTQSTDIKSLIVQIQTLFIIDKDSVIFLLKRIQSTGIQLSGVSQTGFVRTGFSHLAAF
jgi:hypothetical protein